MREYNALEGYPQPPYRIVGNRTIEHRILASYRGWAFFDGPRECGYGGLVDDDRWAPIAERIIAEYSPHSVLQLNCEKGFLLAELKKFAPNIKVHGVEPSTYARSRCVIDVRTTPTHIEPAWTMKESVDLIIAIGVVYMLPLAGAMDCVRRIEQQGHRAFITLASYETEDDLMLFRNWSLLACTILRKDEWLEVLKHCGYTGDYWFVNAETLRLRGS